MGGGIAGLACVQQLTTLGVEDVVMLEAESMLGTHASGRNAAIFRPLEEGASAIWLAQRSRDLLDARLGSGIPMIVDLDGHNPLIKECRVLDRESGQGRRGSDGLWNRRRGGSSRFSTSAAARAGLGPQAPA